MEREKATDNLRKGLERRPDREELVERMVHGLYSPKYVLTHLQAISYPLHRRLQRCKQIKRLSRSTCEQTVLSTNYNSDPNQRI